MPATIIRKKIAATLFIVYLLNMPAFAAGFALYTEASTVALGDFGAGIAAEAADAAIGWYNPAGLVLIPEQQMVFNGVGVFPSVALSGRSIFSTEGVPPYVQSFSNLAGADSAFVPSFHYALPLGAGNRAAFGLSVVAPYGLSTNWSTTSPVRYSATFSQLLTVDVSPEIAGKLTDNLSMGLGLDFQGAKVKFNSVIGSPAALQFLQSLGGLVTPTFLDSTSENEGNSFGLGFHIGLMGMFYDNHLRLGFNYQSKIEHQFTGSSLLTGRLADPTLTNPNATYFSNTLSSNRVSLPDVTTLSAYYDLTDKMALLGSIVYTGWSSFNVIQLNDIAAFSAESGERTLLSSSITEGYRNVWRFAVGSKYAISDTWLVRCGVGYDETPTVDKYRDARLPDASRIALSVGTHYQWRPWLGVDLGYTYLWAADTARVNNLFQLDATSSDLIQATADNQAQLLGGQIVWTMD